jgi:hypothetical protein
MVATAKGATTDENTGTVTFNVPGGKRIRNTVKAQAAYNDHQMGIFVRKLIEIGLREVEKNPELLKEIVV